ncbi:MAG: S1/P1 nuclease [Legionellaceae bacterium]|nr:S1/P1 nuclease [Legionellaceae bacterium]
MALFAWNAEGHRVVAQIALDYMTPSAKARFQTAHPVLDKGKPTHFVEASVWFDTLRGMQLKAFDSMHYVDVPIDIMRMSSDVWRPKPTHGLMAYTGARQYLLSGEKSPLEKAIALRILLHVTADLHQPLHAATRLTKKYPEGDAGGNKVRLPKNKVARNLHTYWDRGAGFLSKRVSAQLRAQVLEKKWPCDVTAVDTNPVHWIAESHIIAETDAYRFRHKKHLDKGYQSMVYAYSQKRLAEAGCRLAAVLNEIDSHGYSVVG